MALRYLLGPFDSRGSMQNDTRTLGALAVVLLLLTAPLELSQLVFAFVGAAAYALVQATQVAPPRTPAAGKLGAKAPPSQGGAPHRPASCRAAPRSAHHGGVEAGAASAGAEERPCAGAAGAAPAARPRAAPAAAPAAPASAWDKEVQQLLDQIAPTNEASAVVQRLARLVKQTLRRISPDVEVFGFASADLVRAAAFGVAVPEVDIVVHVSLQALAGRMQGRAAAGRPAASVADVDLRKLQKSAIRTCTDRLVSNGTFKFRRSAFRGQEPKVTLLVPASLGLFPEAIPIDFSVNATTPLYNSVVLAECGRLEPCLKQLVLLVKRWAKDRGVCHAAKGHLSPYAWTLLAVYFLQVGADQEGPRLPPLEGSMPPSPLSGRTDVVLGAAARRWSRPAGGAAGKPPGQLFQDFVRFYSVYFDWGREAVCVRSGTRGPPDSGLPLDEVATGEGSMQVGLSIEDPFEPSRDLGECTTAASLARMREELERADRLCRGPGASTAVLLEPWVPPERAPLERACQRDGEDAEEGPPSS